MTIRLIDSATVERLTTYESLVPLIRETMVEVSRGAADLPLRSVIKIPGTHNVFGVMPGFLAPANAVGAKLVGIASNSAARGHSSHSGMMVLFDALTAQPQAILCGATLTARRTAAASAVATDALARPDATVMAVLGAGEQARAHVEALQIVRPLEKVRLWARRREAAEELKDTLAGSSGAAIEVADSISEATAGADIICTTTRAVEPILGASEVDSGTHVNLVGASTPDSREAAENLVRVGRYFVDFRASAMNQAGELLAAIKRGIVGSEHVAGEIGEVLTGKIRGRTGADEITIYKSLGIAAQDLAAARHVFDEAEKRELGCKFRF